MTYTAITDTVMGTIPVMVAVGATQMARKSVSPSRSRRRVVKRRVVRRKPAPAKRRVVRKTVRKVTRRRVTRRRK